MKKFLILTLFLTLLTLSVSAEQPAAEQYRQMFASGNFHIEYQMSTNFFYGGLQEEQGEKIS